MGSNTIQLKAICLVLALSVLLWPYTAVAQANNLQNVDFSSGLDYWSIFENDGSVTHSNSAAVMTFSSGSVAPHIAQSFTASETSYELAVGYQLSTGATLTASAAGNTKSITAPSNAIIGGALRLYIHPNVSDIVTLDISASQISTGTVTVLGIWVTTENVPTPTPTAVHTATPTAEPTINPQATPPIGGDTMPDFGVQPLATAIDVSDYDVFDITGTDPLTMSVDFGIDEAQVILSQMRGMLGLVRDIPQLGLWFYGSLVIGSFLLIVGIVRRALNNTEDPSSLPPSINER